GACRRAEVIARVNNPPDRPQNILHILGAPEQQSLLQPRSFAVADGLAVRAVDLTVVHAAAAVVRAEAALQKQRLAVQRLRIPAKAGDSLRSERLEEQLPRNPQLAFDASETEQMKPVAGAGIGVALWPDAGNVAQTLDEHP